MKHYDVIICGGGCAGLHLLFSLAKKKFSGTVLLIEPAEKMTNDRTWSFWEKESNPLESIVKKTWDNIFFRGPGFSRVFDIAPYRYKTIFSLDFYDYGRKVIAENKYFNVLKKTVNAIGDDGVVMLDDQQQVKGDWVFNSTNLWDTYSIKTPYYRLLQHFKGWFIETKKPAFDEKTLTYMDFDIPQGQGGHFVYVLPFSSQRALVEYTVFSPQLLTEKQYNFQIENYIKHVLKITDYAIVEEEFGVIPMTDYAFQKKQSDCVFNIGSGGGTTKPSTGYTFLRAQQQAEKIAGLLVDKKNPALAFQSKLFDKYQYFDSTMLNVLYHEKYPSDQFFTDLLKMKGPHKLFKFLDEETSLLEDLDFVNIPPKIIFFKSFIEEMILRFKGK